VQLEKFNNFKTDSNTVFYASQLSVDYLSQKHIPFRIIQSFQNYPQERILPDFVNKPNRYRVLDKVYLISKQ